MNFFGTLPTPEANKKLTLNDVQSLYLGIKLGTCKKLNQNEDCTLSTQSGNQKFRHTWVLLRIFSYINDGWT